MPAYALQRVNPQQERELEYQKEQLIRELASYMENGARGKKQLIEFLSESDIYSVSEMDYSLRQAYKEYLSRILKRDISTYLRTYDTVKQQWIKKQMQTLEGRKKCQWKFENMILFLPYYPEYEIALEFNQARNRDYMIWDFTRTCTAKLKYQIFITLNTIVEKCRKTPLRDYRLSALHYFYDFCVRNAIQDIEMLEAYQIEEFEKYLDGIIKSRSRKERLLSILNFCRREVFLQGIEINWQANVWYLERLQLPKNKVNPSASFESISFVGIILIKNRRYAQEYMKYLFGVSSDSVSTCVVKYSSVRQFLEWLSMQNIEADKCDSKCIKQYFHASDERKIVAKTYNDLVTNIHQFFRFLVVHNYIEKIPFHIEYYLKKDMPIHHNRSVNIDVYMEVMQNLYLLPEHLRCMFLNLWSLGLRASEVCTLKGNAYYMQGRDAWISVYQIKMKNYKRIPIPMALYQVMQVYIQRHNIKADEYLFKNSKGNAYCRATFCNQMLKFCKDLQIENGEYIFRSHDYRHTLATSFYDTGVSLQSVRDYLGHFYDEMTQQYIDYMPKKIAKASEAFFKDSNHNLAAGLKKGGKHGK